MQKMIKLSVESILKHLKAVFKGSKKQDVSVFSAHGGHDLHLLKIEASRRDFRDSNLEINSKSTLILEKELTFLFGRKNLLDADLSLAKNPIDKEGEINVAAIAEMELRLKRIAAEITNLVHADMDPEAYIRKEKIAQNPISHFLKKSNLSDDLIKSEAELRALRHPNS